MILSSVQAMMKYRRCPRVVLAVVLLGTILANQPTGSSAQNSLKNPFGNFEYVNNAPSQQLIDKFRKEPGVIETRTGLLYKKVEEGEGHQTPSLHATCTVRLEGKVGPDKTIYEIDDEKLITLDPRIVMPGYLETLELMVEGDLFHVLIPAHLAFSTSGGESPDGTARIGGGDVLSVKFQMGACTGARKHIVSCEPLKEGRPGCSGKEDAYIEKWIGKSFAELETEIQHLSVKLNTKDFESYKKHWAMNSKVILERIAAEKEQLDGLEELPSENVDDLLADYEPDHDEF